MTKSVKLQNLERGRQKFEKQKHIFIYNIKFISQLKCTFTTKTILTGREAGMGDRRLYNKVKRGDT